MNKIECQVVLEPTQKCSNIVFDDGILCWIGHRQQKDEDKRRVSFTDDRGNILATSVKDDGFPNIGLDFLWTYVKKNGKIKSVYLFEDLKDLTTRKVRQRENGDVVVERFDEKEYTEKDVVDMICYATAHSGITSKEMRLKVEETLKWFKQ